MHWIVTNTPDNCITDQSHLQIPVHFGPNVGPIKSGTEVCIEDYMFTRGDKTLAEVLNYCPFTHENSSE